MKKFIALLSNKNRFLFNKPFLMEHVAYLQDLKDKGILVTCGPFTDNDRAMQTIHAESIQSAEQIIKSDPFISKQYYEKVEVIELIEATEENNWLIEGDQTKKNLTFSAL